MTKYVRLFFLSLSVTAFAVTLTGCGGGSRPEGAGQGDPKAMTEPGAMEKAAGGKPENMKP